MILKDGDAFIDHVSHFLNITTIIKNHQNNQTINLHSKHLKFLYLYPHFLKAFY